MEKSLYELKIDPEFEKLIPAQTPADYENLARNIVNNGCEDELVTWDGVIVDGHSRYKICHALGIPFAYREKTFETREEAKKWMIQRSFGRRNMSMYDKAVLALKYEEVLKEEAELRMKSGVKADPVHNYAQGSGKGKTRDKMAELAGVSHFTIERVKKLEEVADEATKAKLSAGEATVNKVYTTLFPKGSKKKPSEPEDNEIIYAVPKPQTSGSTPYNVDLIGNKGIHVEGKLDDEEESFPFVKKILEDIADNFLVSLEHSLQQYTSGMVNEENNKMIRTLIRGTSQKANNIFKNRLEEVTNEQKKE